MLWHFHHKLPFSKQLDMKSDGYSVVAWRKEETWIRWKAEGFNRARVKKDFIKLWKPRVGIHKRPIVNSNFTVFETKYSTSKANAKSNSSYWIIGLVNLYLGHLCLSLTMNEEGLISVSGYKIDIKLLIITDSNDILSAYCKLKSLG